MRISALLVWMLLVAVGVCISLSPAQAAGPWRAQVVDAETGKPLEGVVVLAVWYRRYTSPGGWAGGGYYDSEEVVAGPDGRFIIEARQTWTLNPFSTIQGPEFKIFKPGYGQWRFQGYMDWPKDAYEQRTRTRKAWEQFEDEGVVIELPPLKTREDRLKFYRSFGWTGDIPKESVRRLREAVDAERVYLGFRD